MVPDSVAVNHGPPDIDLGVAFEYSDRSVRVTGSAGEPR
jgi:hypothetical protein